MEASAALWRAKQPMYTRFETLHVKCQPAIDTHLTCVLLVMAGGSANDKYAGRPLQLHSKVQEGHGAKVAPFGGHSRCYFRYVKCY